MSILSFGHPSPPEPPLKQKKESVILPMQLIDAYSDINAMNAFVIRESRRIGWQTCAIPNGIGKIAEEVGLSMNSDAFDIMGILYDYFRIKTLEKEAAQRQHEGADETRP